MSEELTEVLAQIRAVCLDNADVERKDLALRFIENLAARELRRLAAAGEQEPVAEVWHCDRKVTVYQNEVIRIWGKNLDEEMSSEPANLETVQSAFDWLYTAPQPAPGWDAVIEACIRELQYCRDHGHEPDITTIRNLKALRSSQSTSDDGGGVRVKPLEWVETLNRDKEHSGDTAETPFGDYSIESDPFSYSPTTAFYVDGPGGFRKQCASPLVAKAAAQADYERRILSTLSNPAAADSNASAEARLREALFVFREFINHNVMQWRIGYHQHPVWLMVVEALGSYNGRNRTQEEWRFIQPDNREALSPDPHASDCEKQGECR